MAMCYFIFVVVVIFNMPKYQVSGRSTIFRGNAALGTGCVNMAGHGGAMFLGREVVC